MKVKAVWEFDFDDSDLDEIFVDIKGFAKDCTKKEMEYMLEHNCITADDFEYVIESEA